MIRLLVANGCSQTRGAELAQPERDAWPAVLARTLGVPHVNLARDGASNRRIVRTTVARLPPTCRDADVQPDETLVLIAWTHSARSEYYVPGKRPQPADHHPVEHNWEDIGPWRMDAGHRPSRAFYDYLWSDEGQVTNLFLDWLLLDRFIRLEGYRVRYLFAGPELLGVPEPARGFVAQLPAHATFGGLPPKPGTSFLDMSEGRELGPGGHPLEDSHALFAAALAKWLRS